MKFKRIKETDGMHRAKLYSVLLMDGIALIGARVIFAIVMTQ